MSRDRLRRRDRRDVPELPPLEPEPGALPVSRPLDRVGLSVSVRRAVARNIRVDVEVCAAGEWCAWAGCGRPGDVRVIARGGELKTRVLCVGHWVAVRAIYVAMADGGGVHYGLGALNVIAMRGILRPFTEG